MMPRTRTLPPAATALALLLTLAHPLGARPSLPPHFASHMVLQREMPVPLWGKAEPGETIRLSFADQSHTTQADKDGNWRVQLKPLATSAEPRSLRVEGDKPSPAGDRSPVLLDDILVGEVWLCSG